MIYYHCLQGKQMSESDTFTTPKTTNYPTQNMRRPLRSVQLFQVCFLIALWCIIRGVDSQPLNPELKYPLHTAFDPVTLTPTPVCYPDEVYITSSNALLINSSSPYYNKCIKCSQFAPNYETCQLYSVRLNIMVIKPLNNYRDRSGSFCRDQNGYHLDNGYCEHKIINSQLSPSSSSEVACLGSMPNCYECSDAVTCRKCNYGYYVNGQQCAPISPTNPNCLVADDNKPINCKMCELGYGLLSKTTTVDLTGSPSVSTTITCEPCPSSWADCTQRTITQKDFRVNGSIETITNPAGQTFTMTITGYIEATISTNLYSSVSVQTTDVTLVQVDTTSNVPNSSILNVNPKPNYYTITNPSGNPTRTNILTKDNKATTVSFWNTNETVFTRVISFNDNSRDSKFDSLPYTGPRTNPLTPPTTTITVSNAAQITVVKQSGTSTTGRWQKSNKHSCIRARNHLISRGCQQYKTNPGTLTPLMPNCHYYTTQSISSGLINRCQSCSNSAHFLLRQRTDCTDQCHHVHPYCDICYTSQVDGLPKCRKCQDGFYVDHIGYCQSCGYLMNWCETCETSIKCTKCQLTFYLTTTGTCEHCETSLGNDCISCGYNTTATPSLVCLKCRNGFYLDLNPANSTSWCLPCLSSCKQCTDDSTCVNCIPEYYYNPTTKLCQDCPTELLNCARCSPNKPTALCVQCATNFALDTDSSGNNFCGPCSSITPNCNSCVGKNRCTQCLLTSQHYINTYKNTCNKCKAPCKTCTKKYKCVSCTKPYLMVVDFDKGVCQACWKHVPNCLQCESWADVSVTPRNTIDGANKYNRCLKCKQHCILKQYPVTLGQSCHQCLPTQYAFYEPNDPYGKCLQCSNQCKSCSSPTECLSCLDAYAQRKANDKIECFDRCGDGKVIDFECDLEVGNEKDGCTSQCTVETGFVCDLYYKLSGLNLTDKTDKVGIRQYIDGLADRNSQEYIYSQCSYKGAVKMKLKRIQKEKFENLISVELSLDPFLHAYKALSAQQLSNLFTVQYQGETLNRTGYNVRLVPKNMSVLLVFPIEKTLTSPLVVTLAHGSVTSIPRKFVYTLDSTLAFRLKDENGLMPFYYSEEQIKLWGSVHTGLQVVSVVGWVAMAVSVILKSIVGVEFLLILQSLYISLTWYQQPLSLQFISLTGLSLSTGYNPASTLDSQHYSSLIVQQSSIPNRLLEYYVNPNSGQYSSLFIQMQFTALLFVIFYLLSYIAWVFQVSYNPIVVLWARYLNNFFYTDCMLVTAMVQLLPLVNQAFLMGYYWRNVGDFDRFIAGNLLVMGLYSLIVVLVRWFRTPHQKYTKIKPKIQPFNLMMQPFSRYNFPLIKQKFINLYIWTMLFSVIACVFGSFHPMMPCLLYTFLAFLVEWYKPYQNMFSNHRAFYYCLVIAFGYLIRTFYLFRFNETSLAKDCRWTIPLWMLMMVVAFVLGVLDVVMLVRREAAERKLRQEEFLAKLLEQNKLLEKATAKQQNVKQYRSHNPHVQNLLYHDYYQHQIGPQVRFEMSDSQQIVDKKLDQAKKKLKPKPIQKNQVQYQSNFNVKRKQGLYDQVDIRDQQTLGNEQWVQLNFWKQSKRKEQQLKQKKKHDLSIAYKAIALVMQFMDDLLKEKGYLNRQLQTMRFNLEEKLVHDLRVEQYDQGLPCDSEDEEDQEAKQKGEENPDTSKQEPKGNIPTRKEMTEMQLGKYLFVDQVDRQRKEYYREGSFPKVEIHYKKAVKRSESERKPMKKEQDLRTKEQDPVKQQENGQKREKEQQSKANFMQALGKSPIQGFFQGDSSPQPMQHQRLQIVKMKLKMLRKQKKKIS